MYLVLNVKHYHFNEIGSTNDYATELLDKEDTVIVTADFQTQGRGRNNHSWHGNHSDNIYFSFGERHFSNITQSELIKYQFVGCLAAQNVLNSVTKTDMFRLKYPNDVYAITAGGSQKIAGILVEHTFSGSVCTKSVIGIGININQTSFLEVLENNPTSLKILGYNQDLIAITQGLTESIIKLNSLTEDKIFSMWKENLNIIGKHIIVSNRPGEWQAKRILNDGRLLLCNLAAGEELIIDNADSIRYEIQ